MSLDFAEVAEELAPGSSLVVFKPNDLATFNSGILDAVEKVAAEARARVAGADISTPAGQALIRSTAYKVAQAKVDLDDLGKQLVENQKKTAAAVDKSRRDMREKLDAVKEEIRKPLTEFEEAEARRKNDHEAAIDEIRALLDFTFPEPDSSAIEARLAALAGRSPREWQEFKTRAAAEVECVKIRLDDMLAKALKRQAEAAELARLQRAEREREQRERDERIAREAAEKAREVERTAAREQAEREARDRELAERFLDDYHAAVLEDSERTAAAELKRVQDEAAKALREKHAAEERARLAKETADREAAAVLVAVREAARKREANKAHRGKINREARDAIAAILTTPGHGPQAVVEAIARGEIPHVTISY